MPVNFDIFHSKNSQSTTYKRTPYVIGAWVLLWDFCQVLDSDLIFLMFPQEKMYLPSEDSNLPHFYFRTFKIFTPKNLPKWRLRGILLQWLPRPTPHSPHSCPPPTALPLHKPTALPLHPQQELSHEIFPRQTSGAATRRDSTGKSGCKQFAKYTRQTPVKYWLGMLKLRSARHIWRTKN